MPSQVNLLAGYAVMDVVFAPLSLPGDGLEGDWVWGSHLDGLADGQVGSGFVVEETKDAVVHVDGGDSEFDTVG